MPIPIYQVDSFSPVPFKGNPAGVCLIDAPRPDEWMRSVAAEMNLSETAFPLPEGDGYRLRWFTPTVEVRLCGHATLATAHILWETGAVPASQTLRFQSLSGLLTAEKNGDWIELNFPTRELEPVQAPPFLLDALAVGEPCAVYRTRSNFLVEVEDEATVRAAAPDFGLLRQVDAHAIILTARSRTPGYDFISRFFAPAIGINEDPVTGSAHSSLTPYWAGKLGKTELSAYQASARGGELRVRLAGDRVIIAGQAVTVLRGELLG